MARGPKIADDGAGTRQSRLAGLLRHRPGGHERRPRHTERTAFAPGTARLAGRRVHGTRVEPEGVAPADRHVGDVSAVVARTAASGGSDQSIIGAGAAVARRG